MRVSTRRDFLRVLGVGGSIVFLPAVFAACDDDSTSTGTTTNTTTNTGMNPTTLTLNLSNDIGILNYAYALEQLEAAFYSAVVVSSPFGGLDAQTQEIMYDLRNHEVIHREFLKQALGSNAIPTLNLSIAAVNSTLTSRDVILRNAEAFEDLGVSAYNGAGKYLTSADYLTVAGKIVSVEARHAAAIRDLRESFGITGGEAAGTRFAGDSVVLASGTYAGLDVKLEPGSVLTRVGATGIVADTINIGTAPTTKSGTPDNGPPSPTP